MFSRIHSVSITVTDQDAAIDFYTTKLGFLIGMDTQVGEGMRWVTVAPPGSVTEIALLAPSDMGPSDSRNGYTGITFTCYDIDGAYRDMSEKGVHFTEPVQLMPWGQKATWFTDPDGNMYFLVEEDESV